MPAALGPCCNVHSGTANVVLSAVLVKRDQANMFGQVFFWSEGHTATQFFGKTVAGERINDGLNIVVRKPKTKSPTSHAADCRW